MSLTWILNIIFIAIYCVCIYALYYNQIKERKRIVTEFKKIDDDYRTKLASFKYVSIMCNVGLMETLEITAWKYDVKFHI